MKMGYSSVIVWIVLVFIAIVPKHLAQASEVSICPRPWRCVLEPMQIPSYNPFTGQPQAVIAKIRSGYLEENQQVPFRGNIIYYEGLGDSMLNHQPLFQKLTSAGYRVIALDYLGQGGSSGDMNDSRIREISELGQRIWKKHAKHTELFPLKTLLGWSTGGLAAYWEAHHRPDVGQVVLIAPGIVPKLLAGEQDPLHGKITAITLESLTSQSYVDGVFNPHLDPIRPSVVAKLPNFAIDFLKTSLNLRTKILPTKVRGLVLLTGEQDLYVNAVQTARVLARVAPHLTLRHYPDSRHEVDNEREPIRSQAHSDILAFLAGTLN